MKSKAFALGCCVALFCLLAAPAAAQELFSKLVGPVQAQPVQEAEVLTVPFITWGGDTATFHANGGLATQPGTIYDGLGLKLQLAGGDDFVGQVKDYMAGKTPFLRGTFSMLGQASEVINSSPDTQAVVFLQLTWSAGDHVVAREDCKSLGDLKGKKVAIQTGGPHSGMLADTLASAGLTWNDVEVVWVDDLTGPGGPAALFQKDPSVDACTVISPDMAALTGDEEPDYDLDSVGTGRGASVKGAHVLNSTAWMSRSICDVYACRKDFYDAHRDVVEKLAAGYIKGCEEVQKGKELFNQKQPAPKYEALLKLSMEIFGEEAVPSEDDAHGLILDCNMVRLPGNKRFFTDKRYLAGFERKQQKVLDVAMTLGNATRRVEFLKADLDYDKLTKLGSLEGTGPEEAGPGGGIQRVLHSFAISFPPNENEFVVERFVQDFQLAIEQAAVCGGAAIVIRGHADPTRMLRAFLEEGRANGMIRKQVRAGKEVYLHDDQPFDLADTSKVLELVKAGDSEQALEIARSAANLSQDRADMVYAKLREFADSKGLDLEANQFSAIGVGAAEPIHPVPQTWEEAKENMRVEFRLQTFPPEEKFEF